MHSDARRHAPDASSSEKSETVFDSSAWLLAYSSVRAVFNVRALQRAATSCNSAARCMPAIH